MRYMERLTLFALIALLAPLAPAFAQDASVFPLPADLYILTSEHRVLRIDATSGGQTPVSPEGQPVAAFQIAPGGGWYAYRTLDNQAVIVASLTAMSGFVLAFDQPLPEGAGGQSIAWSPQGARLAYTVPEGVRVAELSSSGMGEVITTLVEGGPWAGVYWADASTVIATDPAGASARISAGPEAWRVEAIASAPERAAPVEASLTPEGVQLADGRLVPDTAGALAFDWGPLPLPALPEGILPVDLFFVAADEAGVAQVWALPMSGEPVRAMTSSSRAVVDYALAAGRIAYITETELIIAALDGGGSQPLAALVSGRVRPSVGINADASQIAFSDDRGLWTVPADGSQPPRLIVQNALEEDPATLRVYMQPEWSSDETKLLVRVGLYEGALLGVVDVATGAVTELPVAAHRGQWTVDGRVAASSAAIGYGTPGLYLLDPAAPEAEPVTLLDAEARVYDARQQADGAWSVIVGEGAGLGPQWMRLLRGGAARGIAPAFGAEIGAFLEEPALAPAAGLDTPPTLAAGLRNVAYAPDGVWGEPVIADLSSGETWSVPAPGPVSRLMWAR